jgi:arylsulfatase A-like enzyme
MVDQMRGDFFGADGCEVASTPNIDFLAKHGSRFNHAYSASPSCLPARATLWSGQSQWHTGVLGMGWGQPHVPNDFPHTIPSELTKAGYRTHLIGKGHFNPQRTLMGFESSELDESGRMDDSEHRIWFKENANPNVTPDDHGVGFNAWQARPWHTEEYLHPTAWTMKRSLDFIRERDRDKPFFLNISFARPHSPYVPPQYYFDYYYNKELPKAYVGDWAEMHDDPKIAAKPDAWRGKMSDEAIHKARAGYLGEISFIDTQIGRLLNYLKKHDSEAARNTWFIFTSDHGDMQGDHNLWRKTYAYEGSVRIPFIITPPLGSDPEVREVVDEVVELRDIMPTVLAAAGVEIPKTVDGVDLQGVMKESDPNFRKYIHGEHCQCYSHEQEMQYVTDGTRKYIWFPRTDMEQFFDLEEDPGECNNLIDVAAKQEEVEIWRGYLIKELEERDCGWVKDGALFCTESEPLVSPYKEKRWEGE